VRGIVPVVGALLLVLLAAAPALAHAELDTAVPEDGAELETAPTVVRLTFTAGLDASKSRFTLEGPAGDVGTGKAAKDGSKVMTLEDLTLAPGDYGIAWTAVAEDGHIERGTLGFTVLEPTPPPATPTPTPTSAPSTAPTEAPSPTASPTPAPTAAPSPSGTDGDPAASTTDVLLPIVAALVLVAVIGFLVLRRGRTA
jgi:methionine-rich copper-binding protein CopC